MLQVSLITRPRLFSNANIRRMSAVLLFVGIIFGSVMPFSAAASTGAAQTEAGRLQALVSLNQYETALSKTCMSKAVHVELINYCKDAAAERTAELAVLQAWLTEWHGLLDRASLTAADVAMFRALLTMPLLDYESFYLNTMIARKSAALALAESCANSPRSELADLCRQIAASHTAELRALKKWNCAWYGACEALAARPTAAQ